MPDPSRSSDFPYKIAVLCDLRDSHGRILMLHRIKAPNEGLYSPIGGKLDTHTGESPTQCARREILEEVRVDIPIERLRLIGMISEHGYTSETDGSGATNWLLFFFRVQGPIDFEAFEMNEGRLEWVEPERLFDLPLPHTDRDIIWPLIRHHEDGFFAAHIDCTGDEVRWVVEQSTHDGQPWDPTALQ